MIDKVLIIGWDGACWSCMEPLLRRGMLPNLLMLIQQGVRGTWRSTIPPYTNVAWPSLVMGTWPAKTGVFDAARRQPGSQTWVPTNLTGHRGYTIWEWVNRYGRRAAVLNVPMTYPATEIDGYLVTGFDSPRDSSRIAFPPDLLLHWQEQGRCYRVLAEETALMDQQNPHQPRGDLVEFVERWVRLTEEQGELVAWLWDQGPTELMFVVLSGTDSVSHRTNDPDQIARIYSAADRGLGRMVEVVGNRTLVCLVSDHGSTPAARYISLNRAMHRAGWLRFRRQVSERTWRRLPGVPSVVISQVWASIPVSLQRILSWPLLRVDARLAVGADNIDWYHTTVYARSGLGTVYVNQGGRGPPGGVPASSYRGFREKVIAHLSRLRGPKGKHLFSQIWRGEELYPQAVAEDGPPDIVLRPAQWRDHMITGYPQDPLVRNIP